VRIDGIHLARTAGDAPISSVTLECRRMLTFKSPLLLDIPVCLSPPLIAFLPSLSSGAHSDSFGRVSAVTSDDSTVSKLDYRWLRGQKRICSNTTGKCTKAATIQCMSCAKMTNSPSQAATQAYFCSDKCLRQNWPTHKHLHTQTQMHTQMQMHTQQNAKRDDNLWNVRAASMHRMRQAM
jgi:hypothetical protein